MRSQNGCLACNVLAGKVKPGWGDLSIGMKDPLKEIIRRIVEEVDPDKIVLFGSRTKGKSEIWSDYDICVLKSDIVKRNDLEKRIYLKLFGVGVPVDIIVETNERFEKLNEAEK